jgi:hypothetical protein
MRAAIKPRILQFFACCSLLVAAGSAPAQGQCAMCKASAESLSKEGQRTINRAVYTLLIPPVGIGILGVSWALRYGRKRDEEQEADL